MTSEFTEFAARLRRFIARAALRGPGPVSRYPTSNLTGQSAGVDFRELALTLFALQFRHNAACRRFWEGRGAVPAAVADWREIPALPTAAFKEFELSCLPAEERPRVFHSSGTTQHRPSRHFHNSQSLALYEASLLPWFERHLLDEVTTSAPRRWRFLILSPEADHAPHSSLVHMFAVAREQFGAAHSRFLGGVAADGSWTIDFASATQALQASCAAQEPVLLLGTAFSFVHLLDHLAATGRSFQLPAGSRVMETGGYKGRSRSLPRSGLHALIRQHLDVPESGIVCEYGMSELSSQAYAAIAGVVAGSRVFQFPPWARAQIISPETGREVADGQTGLIRVFDLANVFSVMAIQTEDLAIRRGEGFELLGRTALAEPRGCSLMAAAFSEAP